MATSPDNGHDVLNFSHFKNKFFSKKQFLLKNFCFFKYFCVNLRIPQKEKANLFKI